jgi:hypothetical protein
MKAPLSFPLKLKAIHKKLSRRIVFDRHVGINDTIFLSSMGRSGSTFLSNIINHDNRFRVLFEPFRHDIVEQAKEFVYPFYLRPDNVNVRYYLSAKKIVSGRVGSQWINKENNCSFPKARLIKDIRSNFFLKWLKNRFPDLKVILLMRHPCAVVHSWISAGFGDGRISRERLLENHHFVSDMDDNLLKAYTKAETDFERLIFFWCFHYYVPLRQFDPRDIYLLFYEKFIMNPEDEARKLFQFLGYDYSEDDVLKSLSKPSSTTNKSESFFSGGDFRIDRWQDSCLEHQSARAYEIMKLFGMDELYCPVSSIPNDEAAEKLLVQK